MNRFPQYMHKIIVLQHNYSNPGSSDPGLQTVKKRNKLWMIEQRGEV